MTSLELLFKALAEGGQYSLAILGWLAWWYERKQNKEYGSRLFDLANAQIEATVKHEAAIRATAKLMERF